MAKYFVRKNLGSKGVELEDYIFSTTDKESSHIERPIEKRRLNLFWVAVLLSLFVLEGRAIYLNVVKGEYYQKISKGNSIRSVVIKAPRGKIFDRFGNALVSNIPSMDIVFIPADLPEEGEKIKQMAENLSEVLSINKGELLIKFQAAEKMSVNPLLIKENVSQDEYLIFTEKQKEFPGILIDKTAVRNYFDGYIFSHTLGYAGKIEKKEYEENSDYLLTDYIGKIGIEKSYERELKGIHGALQFEVDSTGDVKKERGMINPVPGNDLFLSLDAQLQKKIFDSLNSVMEKTKTKTAAAVAMNPKNGEILALVSLPSFDNNLFSKKISNEKYQELVSDPAKPLFNRVISGKYPPGSTIKPIIAAAALSENTISENTNLNCSGAIQIGSYRFRDWTTHGTTDVKKAIAESCDIFFYALGGGYGNIGGLGMERMKQYYEAFGLGKATGVDIPGEEEGFIPDENWKLEKLGEKWYIGNSYHAAIGQGYITATPLQLASYVSAIANGGNLFEPKIVSQIRDSSEKINPIHSRIIRENFISSPVMKVVRDGMRQTVVSGTAQSLSTLPIEVAGKTGTAQFGSGEETHAWFVSFAPFNDPEIAMVVLVEGGGEGHSSAVPVTKEVYEWYFGERNKI